MNFQFTRLKFIIDRIHNSDFSTFIFTFKSNVEGDCFRKKPLRQTFRSKRISGNWDPFKNDEKWPFLSPNELFSCWKYLSFSFDLFGSVGKRLDKKAKVNLVIYGVTNWETNNYNIHLPNISRSKVNKKRSNRIQNEKHFP